MEFATYSVRVSSVHTLGAVKMLIQTAIDGLDKY